ncbi:MAG: hypothetical protein IKN55_04175 [Oscillospiraceae bacterium]|nr:hypothetical protein [Oscillospiraceae bacterium]
MTVLLICGILCILGAAALGVLAFLPGRAAAHTPERREPLPGGDGVYTLSVTGMNSIARVTAVEAALAEFPALNAETDLDEGTIVLHYKGYPDLEMLDAVKQAVESTGCKVSEIE